MKKIPFLAMITCAMACHSEVGFTERERALIGDRAEAGAMRVLKTEDTVDSLQLRRVSEPLTAEEIRTQTFAVLKARMLATVNDPENAGVGIAAPQVGVMKRLIAVERHDRENPVFEYYINPRIERYSTETTLGTEGCLSIPARSESVARSCSVTVSYLEEATGNRREEVVEGFTAVIFQHEIDHLNGILYIDRLGATGSAEIIPSQTP